MDGWMRADGYGVSCYNDDHWENVGLTEGNVSQ